MEGSTLMHPLPKRLEGKVALITGGASGIGASTSRLFVKHGAKVVVADIQDDLGRSLCDEIDSDDTICFVHCDVRLEADVAVAVDTAVSKFGKLDVMFSNAGINGNMDSRLSSHENDEVMRVLDVNLVGAVWCAKHASRVMIPAKSGVILFTSSVCSVTFGVVNHAYAASKSGIVGLTKNLCVELGKDGIRVNCISPFGVASPSLQSALDMDKEKVEEIVRKIANLAGASVDVDDVANAALYLGSDESKYVSGLNLVIDGGYSLTNDKLFAVLKDL